MSTRRMTPCLLVAALALVLALAGGPLANSAAAAEVAWRLEQPRPPESSVEAQGSETPIGLGEIGDIEFSAANRGLLITHGNGGTVPAGIWDYNGEGWHELAKVCGATDGRIAWAGPATTGLASGSTPEEFWTVSDGRPGQAANPHGDLPPLEDNTLCHFAVGAGGKLEVLDSYASLGFEANSYQAMDAAACVSSTDCWFAGAPLPAPQLGAFQLHWNGSSVEPEPNTRVASVRDLRIFAGKLYEGVGLPQEAEGDEEEILHPSILQEIEPTESIFVAQHPARVTHEGGETQNYPLPEYAPGSFPQALEPLHLSADEASLWAAAGPEKEPPGGSSLGELTVLHELVGGGSSEWSQVLGPGETGEARHPRKSGSLEEDPSSLEEDVVNSIAAEPETESAWLAVDTQLDGERPSPTALATVVHVQADGELSEEQLPSVSEREKGVGPKGAAYRVTCPAKNDCWMATTQGWLFHLSEEDSSKLPPDTAQAFNGPLIASRPRDQGLPQEPSDAQPIDDSGLEESQSQSSSISALKKSVEPSPFATVSVPLLSDVHTRLLHGTTLELSFHLAVKARVRLLAKRHSHVVASTPMRTLKAGKRSLQLRLNVNRWPTKLDLQTQALAPLPTVSSLSSGVETISTSLAFPKAIGITGWGPSL
jgi:hypothetical protein